MIASEETLRHLMIKAQGGDKLCYSSLLTECEKWLRRYYARKINPAAIDDLVQETLISLHRKRASYDPARAFLPWLEDVTAKASLERLLGMIPSRQAEVISLVKIEGLTINEAAAMTGQSETLVKVNIHRGLKRMSALIESE